MSRRIGIADAARSARPGCCSIAGTRCRGCLGQKCRVAGQGPAILLVRVCILASDKTLGVNADLSRYDAEQRTQLLQGLEEAGFRWLDSDSHGMPWNLSPVPMTGRYGTRIL